jgi:hypothetical protein
MRKFLNDLSQLKIIDGKKLKSKDVIYIVADDNPNIHDFENSYNLEYEVTLL